MVNLILIVGFLINLIIFHFLIWKQIRHDVSGKEAVSYSWKLIGLVVLMSKLFYLFILVLIKQFQNINWVDGWYFLPLMWMFVWMLQSMNSKNNKLKWQPGWDDVVSQGLVIFVFSESLKTLFIKNNILNWLISGLLLLLIVFIYWVKPRYRRFKLYASGKSGFLFWTSFILVSLIEMTKSGFYYDWGRWINLVVSVICLIGAMVGWYKRAGRKISKDFPWLYYWFK